MRIVHFKHGSTLGVMVQIHRSTIQCPFCNIDIYVLYSFSEWMNWSLAGRCRIICKFWQQGGWHGQAERHSCVELRTYKTEVYPYLTVTDHMTQSGTVCKLIYLSLFPVYITEPHGIFHWTRKSSKSLEKEDQRFGEILHNRERWGEWEPIQSCASTRVKLFSGGTGLNCWKGASASLSLLSATPPPLSVSRWHKVATRRRTGSPAKWHNCEKRLILHL